MAADRAKVCLQKKAFAPYALPSETLDRQFYVKVYSGNNLTDQPEFREVQQRSMKLSSLLATRDDMLQFKVDLDRYADRFFPGLARTTANVGCAFCKKDAYFSPTELLPFLALHFVHIPTLLARNIYPK